MSIMTIGIDLAKNVFTVHGVDDNGKAALVEPKVSREQLLPLIMPWGSDTMPWGSDTILRWQL